MSEELLDQPTHIGRRRVVARANSMEIPDPTFDAALRNMVSTPRKTPHWVNGGRPHIIVPRPVDGQPA